jgi:hypothetical protein
LKKCSKCERTNSKWANVSWYNHFGKQ